MSNEGQLDEIAQAIFDSLANDNPIADCEKVSGVSAVYLNGTFDLEKAAVKAVTALFSRATLAEDLPKPVVDAWPRSEQPAAWMADLTYGKALTASKTMADEWSTQTKVTPLYVAPVGVPAHDLMVEALKNVVKQFGPVQNDLIFSKRLAIDQARAALVAATAGDKKEG